ncbi:ABC transporter ATP-binding protein [Candidatus Phycorickettsia trachydisci]|nr:ABC transporter ATP-binding protein [Candidatus Phycorickettsia trachydisci]
MFITALVWAFDISFRKYLIKNMLDTAVKYQNSDNLIEALLVPAVLYVFMALLLTTIFRIYGYFIDIKMCPLLRQKIFDKCYTKLLNHDHAYYQKNFTGDLAYKLNNLTESIIEIIKLIIGRFFACIVALIISIYTLALVNIKFAVATSIWAIIFIAAAVYFFPKLAGLADNESASSAKVNAIAADSLLNIISIKLFNNKLYERLKLFRHCQKKLRAEKNLNTAYFWVWFTYGYSFNLLEIFSIYFLIQGFQSGGVTIGDFALVIGLNIAIVDFLNQLTNDLTKFSDHYGKVQNAIATIFVNPEIKDKKDAKNLIVQNGKISFENVTFSYNSKDLLFNDLSVSINPKEKVGLVGYTGAGKSSFVNLILKLFEVKSGRISIDDQFISDVRQDSIRDKISVVPQDLILFHDTILENILYGKPDANPQEIVEASKLAGIDPFINRLPDGYNTIVGEKGFKLSGGERQRISIARAFLKNAPILILDEATNQLDSITEKAMQASLFKLMEQKTAIVIAHRLSTLLHMDRILVFDKGKILQDGPHHELIKMPGLYRKLWNAQTDDILKY